LATRKRKQEYDARRKAESMTKKDAEQAMDVDMPVGGKEVEQVDKRLKKAALRDDKVGSDSDEDMLPPGERMG